MFVFFVESSKQQKNNCLSNTLSFTTQKKHGGNIGLNVEKTGRLAANTSDC
jgi:hypothetical protein